VREEWNLTYFKAIKKSPGYSGEKESWLFSIDKKRKQSSMGVSLRVNEECAGCLNLYLYLSLYHYLLPTSISKGDVPFMLEKQAKSALRASPIGTAKWRSSPSSILTRLGVAGIAVAMVQCFPPTDMFSRSKIVDNFIGQPISFNCPNSIRPRADVQRLLVMAHVKYLC
jgi:hypothetical protein